MSECKIRAGPCHIEGMDTETKHPTGPIPEETLDALKRAKDALDNAESVKGPACRIRATPAQVEALMKLPPEQRAALVTKILQERQRRRAAKKAAAKDKNARRHERRRKAAARRKSRGS